MTQISEWLAMGGYSYYVWPAYGIVCTVLVVNLIGLKLQSKATRRKLQLWFKR